MSVDVKILDSKGTSRGAKVDADGRVHVRDNGLPPFGGGLEYRIYRDYLRDSSGGSDMLVDGSTTPIEFEVKADQISDRYITTLSFLIEDASATLRQFGNIGALATGFELFYEDETGVVIINESLKTNWDFVRLSGGFPAMGDAATVFQARNVRGNAEAYIPVIDMSKIFGLPYGLRLKAGSSQRLVLRVNDDVTGVDTFDCVVYGFDRLRE